MASTINTQLAHLKIPLEDILNATNNFADDYIIGKGGFGNVYKGRLNRNGKSIKIAARRLDRTHGQGDVEFWTEISVLSDLNHKNIVSIIGFCDEKGEKIIVNRHYANGSLQMHLSKTSFTGLQRLNVCTGVAAALSYIHDVQERGYFVIHRNINSSTILLDKNWEPKLSGFEFSIKQPVDKKRRVFLSKPIGTKGYIDPEIANIGGVTFKSDVYSLGVVLFEIICGKRANEDGMLLAPLAKFHLGRNGRVGDLMDPDLLNQLDPKAHVYIPRIAIAAYACLEKESLRPSVSGVFQMLKRLQTEMDTDDKKDQYEEITNDDREKDDTKFDSGVDNTTCGPAMLNTLEHLRIELQDIQLATNNFSKESTIEQGKHYSFYKAELVCFDKDYRSFVNGKNKYELPKKLYNVTIKCIHSPYYDYNNEILSLSHCNHQNIQSLLGFCEQGSEVILVYESVVTNYLHESLYTPILTWEKRLKICIDVAHGLSYLHNEIEDHIGIIHGNIRCNNILLDDNDRAKIGGFECSKLLHMNKDFDDLHLGKAKTVVEDAHVDPEYVMTGMLKRESDVFSFGVVMLEVLCGFCAQHLVKFYEAKGPAELARRWIKERTIKSKILHSIMEEKNEKHHFLHKGPNEDSLDTFIKIVCWCLEEKQSQRPTMKVVIEELEKALAWQENSKHELIMSLEEIKMATQNFKNLIGGGGFGRVYKGEVVRGQDNRHCTIVAKKLDKSGGQGDKQFYNELEILSSYKHDNIVSLVGYNEETDEKVIVYEYASWGSLDQHLKNASLTWRNRLKLCIDAATGLEFLHEGVGGNVVIHRDIKAANILLFDDWKAKLGDFGLSLICRMDKKTNFVIDHPCGTEDYVDPQYFKTGLLTSKSDIYSFGVVLFEILCGRATYRIPKPKNKSLLCFIKHNFEEGKQDEMVFETIKEEIVPDSLTTFLNIVYRCLDEDREKRPTSKEVLAELKNALEFQDEDIVLDPVTT